MAVNDIKSEQWLRVRVRDRRRKVDINDLI